MPRGGKRENAGRKPKFKDAKIYGLHIEREVLDSIPGDKQEFIREAIIHRLAVRK